MGEAELLIAGLLVAVAGLSALARQLSIPYPIVLVIGGAAMGFVPGLPEVKLNPEVVLVIFLPPLLYAAAFFANLNHIRASLRPLTLTTVLLVLVTMTAVAVVAHGLIGGLSWAAAFALGAVVSPTDPLAGAAIMRRLGMPRRLVSSSSRRNAHACAHRTADPEVGSSARYTSMGFPCPTRGEKLLQARQRQASGHARGPRASWLQAGRVAPYHPYWR